MIEEQTKQFFSELHFGHENEKTTLFVKSGLCRFLGLKSTKLKKRIFLISSEFFYNQLFRDKTLGGQNVLQFYGKGVLSIKTKLVPQISKKTKVKCLFCPFKNSSPGISQRGVLSIWCLDNYSPFCLFLKLLAHTKDYMYSK